MSGKAPFPLERKGVFHPIAYCFTKRANRRIIGAELIRIKEIANMNTTLQNGRLTVTISSKGAELQSIKD